MGLIFYRYVGYGLADGGEDDGIVLGEVLETLQRLLQSDGIVARQVLHVIALNDLTILANQTPELLHVEQELGDVAVDEVLRRLRF